MCALLLQTDGRTSGVSGGSGATSSFQAYKCDVLDLYEEEAEDETKTNQALPQDLAIAYKLDGQGHLDTRSIHLHELLKRRRSTMGGARRSRRRRGARIPVASRRQSRSRSTMGGARRLRRQSRSRSRRRRGGGLFRVASRRRRARTGPWHRCGGGLVPGFKAICAKAVSSTSPFI